jgi:DNA-binding response OmpR family regulator
MSDIHLLIVDKEESDRDKLKNMAASAGFTFDTASDGIMALKLFRRHDYHLVILNMELPIWTAATSAANPQSLRNSHHLCQCKKQRARQAVCLRSGR